MNWLVHCTDVTVLEYMLVSFYIFKKILSIAIQDFNLFLPLINTL